MLESCQKRFDAGSGLIKLANPAVFYGLPRPDLKRTQARGQQDLVRWSTGLT